MKRTSAFLLLGLFLLSGLTGQAQSVSQLIAQTGGAEEYPAADYLVVFDSTHVDMQESGLSYYHTHQLFKVLTGKGGRQLHSIRYGYDPMSAYAEIQQVIVHRRNGETETFNREDHEINYVTPGGTILWGASEKLIDLGRLEPGDAVEVFLFKKGYTYALLDNQADEEKYIPPMRGHFYDIIPFWVSQPTLTKYYQVDIPVSKEPQYELYNGGKVLRSEEKKSNGKNAFCFWAEDLKPFDGEPNMVAVSDVAPKVLLSTAPDWFSKSKWFYNVNEDFGSFDSTPEIDAKVAEILRGAEDELDSVSRLTHWVADEIRYFGLNMGDGEGYTLHKGEMTFNDRCGVCKDKAGLLVTFLRAAGFESYAAMTMAGSRIDYIPADQFNHSVAAVRLADGKLHMLDPTWVPFVRELWSSAEQQQNYIIGLPDGQDLQETPISDPENHYLKIDILSRVDSAGNLNCTMDIRAEGQTDASFRRMFTGADKKLWDINLQNLILNEFPNATLYTSTYEPENIIQVLDGPIHLTYTFRIKDYLIDNGEEVLIKPVSFYPLFQSAQRQFGIDTSLKVRRYPFRESCSRLVEINETITFTGDIELVYQPRIKTVRGSGADYQIDIQTDQKKLSIRQEAVYKKRIYQPEDWASFRSAVMAQKDLSKAPLILKLK